MQAPVKSHFERVHRVSEFGGLNLVKTPFELRAVQQYTASYGEVLLSELFPGCSGSLAMTPLSWDFEL
jgi:hypothetical protein